MEDIQIIKQDIRNEMETTLAALSPAARKEKLTAIETRLFEFANFLEAGICLLYVAGPSELPMDGIIRRSFEYNKIVILPAFHENRKTMTLLKVDNPDTDLVVTGVRGVLEPDPSRCKQVPIECVDIAVIPAVALDEKGGRIGTGRGYYDRLIPQLPMTTRKVALGFEEQVIQQVPMESHDRHVDIVITEKRTIYKI